MFYFTALSHPNCPGLKEALIGSFTYDFSCANIIYIFLLMNKSQLLWKLLQMYHETKDVLSPNWSPCMDYTDQNFVGKDSNAKFISCSKTKIWPKFQESINCFIAGETASELIPPMNSIVLLWTSLYYTLSSTYKIWHFGKSLFTFWGLISYLARYWNYFTNFLCHWANFYCCTTFGQMFNTSSHWSLSVFKNGPSPASFSFISSFQTNMSIFTTNKCAKISTQ